MPSPLIFLAMALSVTDAQPDKAVILDAHDHILSPDQTYAPYPAGWRPGQADALLSKQLLMSWLQSPIRGTKEYDPFALDTVDNYLNNTNLIRSKILDYDIQYIGVRYIKDNETRAWVYRSNGQAAVLLHGIRRDRSGLAGKLDEESIVFDGGTNYFDALIDIAKSKVIWFSAHGVG